MSKIKHEQLATSLYLHGASAGGAKETNDSHRN